MRNCFYLIILLVANNILFAQTIRVSVANLNVETGALSSLSGERISFIDSISVNNKNEFEFNLEEHNPGIYRLTFNNKTWLDFIYDNEDIEIETDANNILDSLKVIKSESNEIYYVFIKLNKDYKTKSELLQIILARYPKEDAYYQTTQEKLISYGNSVCKIVLEKLRFEKRQTVPQNKFPHQLSLIIL